MRDPAKLPFATAYTVIVSRRRGATVYCPGQIWHLQARVSSKDFKISAMAGKPNIDFLHCLRISSGVT